MGLALLGGCSPSILIIKNGGNPLDRCAGEWVDSLAEPPGLGATLAVDGSMGIEFSGGGSEVLGATGRVITDLRGQDWMRWEPESSSSSEGRDIDCEHQSWRTFAAGSGVAFDDAAVTVPGELRLFVATRVGWIARHLEFSGDAPMDPVFMARVAEVAAGSGDLEPFDSVGVGVAASDPDLGLCDGAGSCWFNVGVRSAEGSRVVERGDAGLSN